MGKLIISLAVAAATSIGAFAADKTQTPSREEIMAEMAAAPGRSGGIYFAYPFTTDSVPPVPKGYRPVCISHYGRHGSRWALREEQYGEIVDVLVDEESRNNLTEIGKEVLAKVRRIATDAKGHTGELTQLGAEQHKGIAKRMMRRTPSLFADSARVRAISSVEPRCIVSMAAFSEGLKEENPRLKVVRTASPGDMSFIAWDSPETKAFGSSRASWREDLKKYREKVVPTERLMKLLFVSNPRIADRTEFVKTLHDIAITTQNTGVDADLLSLFNADELWGLWQAINYQMYVRHANSALGAGSGPRSARSLLADIINRVDAYLEGDGDAVTLRFGHDTALIRLLALMDIDGMARKEVYPDRYWSAWQDYRVAPMGGNLQLIFFRAEEEDDPLVLILHNERPVSLPIEAASGSYYLWSDVRDHWQKQLLK